MKATWKTNSVEFVQWNGDNIDEVKAFVQDHRIFTATDGSGEIYIVGIGIARNGDYVCKNGNYAYEPFTIYSYKVFPRIINEDIGSGLSI